MSGKTGVGNRKLLLLIFALSAAPFVLATLIYFVWKPAPQSIGVLLTPIKTLPAVVLRNPAGAVAVRPKGQWILLMASTAPCGEVCKETLHRMRQVRLAQGADMLRLSRVWVSALAAEPEFANAAQEGLVVQIDPHSELIASLPLGAAALESSIYLLDPLGNLVMRYDAAVDPVKMLREINKIMKINNGLG